MLCRDICLLKFNIRHRHLPRIIRLLRQGQCKRRSSVYSLVSLLSETTRKQVLAAGHDKSCKIDPPATEWSSGSGSNRFPMQIRPYKRSVRYRCLSDFVTDKCRTNVTDMPSLTSEPSPTRLLRSLIGQFFTLILMVASDFAQTYGNVPNLASAPPASVTQVQLG